MSLMHNALAFLSRAPSQNYEFMDPSGKTLWRKARLWSYDVLFQPDFTNPSCQGQWCPGTRMDDAAKQLVL